MRPFRLHDVPWPSMWQDLWGSASFLLHTDSDGKVHNDLHNTDLQYLKFKYTYADPELRKYRERILHESLPRMLNERWFTANYSMLLSKNSLETGMYKTEWLDSSKVLSRNDWLSRPKGQFVIRGKDLSFAAEVLFFRIRPPLKMHIIPR